MIQVTPPGSACSIVFGTGLGGGVAPGSLKGASSWSTDIEEAHAFLEERGIANSGPQHFLDGQMTPGLDPNRAVLRHVRLLRRPRRQLLGRPGSPAAAPADGATTYLEAAFEQHRRELHVHC